MFVDSGSYILSKDSHREDVGCDDSSVRTTLWRMEVGLSN